MKSITRRSLALALLVVFPIAGCNDKGLKKTDEGRGSGSPTPKPPALCHPTVVPTDTPSPTGNTSVRVYWDISGSMSEFAGIIRSLIDSLDSKVLPKAGAGAVTHLLVGDGLTQLKPGDLAQRAEATQWSALHTAARDAGKQQATIGVAIIISDMVVEVPAAVRKSGPELCPGLAMPTSAFAGPAFGRCFAAGVREGPTGGHLASLYAEVFQHPPAAAPHSLFITILGANVALGRAIGDELRGSLTPSLFAHRLLVDTSWEASTPSCQWETELLELEQDARGEECKVRCAGSGVANLQCTTGLPEQASGLLGWASPQMALAVRQESSSAEVTSEQPRAALSSAPLPQAFAMDIGCGPGRAGSGDLDVTIGLTVQWKASVTKFDLKDENARDALESLQRALPDLLASVQRHLRIDLYGG